MKLELIRFILGPVATIGMLRVDGAFHSFTCEDTYRPPPQTKIPTKTAIPNGTYDVEVTYSPRFKVMMPLVKNVPGFEGIRVHPGNVPADTDGCLLVGFCATKEGVTQSRLAYEDLFTKIQAAGGKATLEIRCM